MRIVSRRVVARTTRMERIMLDALTSAIGRFPKTVPMLAAHAPAMGKLVPPSPGTFPSYRGLFVGFFVGVGLIIGGLAFAPAFTLGPVAGNMTIPASALS